MYYLKDPALCTWTAMSCTPSLPDYALRGEDRVNNTITTTTKPTLSLSHKDEVRYMIMNTPIRIRPPIQTRV